MTASVERSDAGRDAARVEAFTKKIIDILNGGALSLMISVGHRTGLFDTMADLTRTTSSELASKAGLRERYAKGATPVRAIWLFSRNTFRFSVRSKTT